MIKVVQLGPAIGTTGGMASVIEEYLQFDMRGYSISAIPTWRPGKSVSSMASAAWAPLVATLRGNSIIHVHISERGSFIREGGAVLFSRLLRRHVVATLHGADFMNSGRIMRLVISLILKSTHHVICLGPTTQGYLLSEYKIAHTSVLPNPVRIPQLSTHKRSGVVVVGEIGLRKGTDRLLAGWDKLKAATASHKLTMAGPIARGYELPQLDETVHYVGEVSRTSALDLISRASVLCLLSRREVLPMVCLEALARGTRVIVSDAGECSSLSSCEGVTVLSQEQCEDPVTVMNALLRNLSASYDTFDESRKWIADNASDKSVAKGLRVVYEAVQSN